MAMRLLFVDQDPSTVEALRKALWREHVPWDLTRVSSAEAALGELDRGPCDVVIADLDAPTLDGVELLKQIRDRYPQVVRLCLSSSAEDDVFLRAVPVTQQFLRKPCSSEGLRELVERACSLRGVLHNRATLERIGRLKSLPTTPQTFQALAAATAREDAHLADITGIVSQDTALAVKTLQIVNSAFFRRGAPITSIQAAVSYVGWEMLKSLALSACVFSALDDSPKAAKLLKNLQARSIRKAHFARSLLDQGPADEAFTAALLLDIGQAVLAISSPPDFERMLATARERGVAYHELEREFFGATHAEVGACLLGLWGLPLELIEAVAYHHTPSRVQHAHTRVLAAVHLADTVIDATPEHSRRLLDQLDGAFIARTEVVRCLKAWNIDPTADARAAQRSLEPSTEQEPSA